MYKERIHHLLTFDKFAKLEQKFFEASAGAAGMERVQELIKSLLPTLSKRKLPLAVLRAFNDLSQDKHFTFAGTGAQTLFTNCKSFVKAICEGSSPSFQGATETPFLKSIKDQLLLFAETDVSGSSSETARTIKGKPAVEHQYSKVEGIEAPTHPDLTMLSVYGWCLSKVQQEQVKEWRDKASAAGAGHLQQGKQQLHLLLQCPKQGPPKQGRLRPSTLMR